MPPTQNEKLIDVFQDGCEPGVKELFETHEEALLPISEQLQRYKKRDLYSSHFHRTSCKLLGPRTSVHRIHVLSENPFDISDDIDTESHFATWSEETLLSSRRESKLNLRTEDEITKHEYKNWLSERQKLRSDLNNLGLIVPWLIHKPEKTCLEERVLDKLLQNKKNLLPEADVRSIPGFIRNILKKLSTYMIKNKILLRKLFGNSIATKKISLKQCKEGLTKVKQNIFISVDDIDDIVTFFYHNNENNTSFYSALMHTMEQQELQNNKPSNLLAPFSSEREELKSVSSRSKAAVSTDNELISKASLVSIEDIREKSLTPVMRRRMRDTRVKEFKEAFKSCQDQGLISLRDQLQKSLLHPGDLKKSTSNSDMLVTPTGRLLPKDFWKNKEKFKTLKKARHVTSPVAEKDSGVSKKRKNEAAIITLPRLRDVTADGHSVNLSTGRAIIKRKVDCWLSQEEYDKLLSSEEAVVKRVPPMPNAFWPGHLLDKQRLCMSTSGPEDEAIRTNAIFHRVKVLPFNGKRTNPGYDNNELTWPTDGHYVIYGNYDSTKTYQV